MSSGGPPTTRQTKPTQYGTVPPYGILGKLARRSKEDVAKNTSPFEKGVDYRYHKGRIFTNSPQSLISNPPSFI